MFLLSEVGVERKLLVIYKDRNIADLEFVSDSLSKNDDTIHSTAFTADVQKKCLIVRTTSEFRFCDL